MSTLVPEEVKLSCPKIGKNVTITFLGKPHLTFKGGIGHIDAIVRCELDGCTGQSACGVEKWSGPVRNLDWEQCVNPEIRQSMGKM